MGQLSVSLSIAVTSKIGDLLYCIYNISLLHNHCFSAFHTTAGDYASDPYTVSFTAGQMYATLMVSTVDDNTTELSEYFRVVITSTSQPSVVRIGSPNVSFITVEDNDPGMIYLLTVPRI